MTSRGPVGESTLDKIVRIGWDVTESGCWEWRAARLPRGYGIVSVQRRNRYVHREAYGLWVGDIPKNCVVRHRCDNPPCLNPSHLEIGTQADNVRDALERDRLKLREDHPSSKLTWKEVREIRALYAVGGSTQKALSDRFGVNFRTVHLIVHNKLWKEAMTL